MVHLPSGKGIGKQLQFHVLVGSLAEARAYLENPVLGATLVECTAALLKHVGVSATIIMGPVDVPKLHGSCGNGASIHM